MGIRCKEYQQRQEGFTSELLAQQELTPAVALFSRLLPLAVTDLRLSCSSTSDAAMK